ncbi:MAG: glycosyltransferase [Desulfurococcaceae archaeon]
MDPAVLPARKNAGDEAAPRGTEGRPKVWMLTFESAFVKKVGGLAEVPPRLAGGLASRGLEPTIVMPGHGVTKGYQSSMSTVHGVLGSYEVFRVMAGGVEHLLIAGGVLDDEDVYGRDVVLPKAIAFADAVRSLAEALGMPDVVHANDWHSVPSLLALNARATSAGLPTKFVYHIHLLSKEALELSELARVIDPNTVIRGVLGAKSLAEYHLAARGLADRLGALASDVVVTVSKGYSKEVSRRLGIKYGIRVEAVSNAATWSWLDVSNAVLKLYPGLNPFEIESRLKAREQLETKDLCKAVPEGHERAAPLAREYALDLAADEWLRCFDESGPLLLMTGRLARQKGVHVLLRALPRLISRRPDVRILLALIPVEGHEDLALKVLESALIYRENLKVLLGYVPREIYMVLHYAADALVAPSLQEPFGLVSLEAMAAGTPVVASSVGGLAEAVIDIRLAGPSGTGLLVEPGDAGGLATSLADMVNVMESAFDGARGQEISEPRLRNLLAERDAVHRIRESCIRRAHTFTWERSAEVLVSLYGKIMRR